MIDACYFSSKLTVRADQVRSQNNVFWRCDIFTAGCYFRYEDQVKNACQTLADMNIIKTQ